MAVFAALYFITRHIGLRSEVFSDTHTPMVEMGTEQPRLESYNSVLGNYNELPLWRQLVQLPVSLALQFLTPLPWAFSRDVVFVLVGSVRPHIVPVVRPRRHTALLCRRALAPFASGGCPVVRLRAFAHHAHSIYDRQDDIALLPSVAARPRASGGMGVEQRQPAPPLVQDMVCGVRPADGCGLVRRIRHFKPI